MSECWASSIGSCTDKISREHIVSRGLFEGDIVMVKGFSWCRDEPRKIGLSSLTSKILCEKHNADLSVVDQEGASAFKYFREFMRLSNVRKDRNPQLWKVMRYSIDGPILERWFLKTLINISVNENLPIGEGSHPGRPTEELVGSVFGLRPFSGHAGLYSIARAGQNLHLTDTVMFAPLFKDKAFVAGGFFAFRGFKFLMYLLPETPPAPLTDIWFNGEPIGMSQLKYHLRCIEERHGNHLSQFVEFNW